MHHLQPRVRVHSGYITYIHYLLLSLYNSQTYEKDAAIKVRIIAAARMIP